MNLDQTNAFTPASPTEPKGARLANRVSKWSARHPIWAIALVSLIAVVINCYPVIFCGKSFVSPASVDKLVYGWWPPLPGMKDSTLPVASHGTDTYATMLWEVPVGFIESRSLLEHGELPLWNRYSHAGDTLIGQNETMLGDPLQLIVILGRGSAGAWDVKFLVAKFLFCVGFGLLILRLLANRPLSLIYAALAAYCGAFFYIGNHPVFFVFCYAPWILLSALAWLDVGSERNVVWALVWLLANFACFNAGHVEVAVDLIGGLNLTALVHALARNRKAAGMAAVIGRMSLVTILFLGLTAPMWTAFFAALKGSYSLHSEIHVVQLPAATLPGAFDDLYFQLLLKSGAYAAIAPGASVLVMVGCFLSALRWRQLKGETFFWVNGGAILLWGGCVFGWVPAAVLEVIPLLNHVGHTHTDFSYLLVVQLAIQSAYGFNCLAQENNFRRAAADLLWTALIFGGLILVYCFEITHDPIPWGYVLFTASGGFGAPLLFTFLKSYHRQISAVGWTGIIILGFFPHFRFGLYNFGRIDWAMIPGPRVVLDAPSQAVDTIRADRSGLFRVVGLGNFVGDYSAVYELEDIRSCAPLSDGEFINLVREFPGVKFGGAGGWEIYIDNPVAAQPLLNLLNVKYLLIAPFVEIGEQMQQAIKRHDFRIIDRSDFLILENSDAWPRAFFSDHVVPVASNEEFIGQLLKNGKQPFIALPPEEVRNQPGLRQLENTNKATVWPATNYSRLPNSTAFDVHAPSAGVVCLTEEEARDFSATANNEARKVFTVNRAFKGIYLDKPGDYHIVFTYRPRHWRLACALFWIAVGTAAALAAISLARAKRRNGNNPVRTA